MTVQVVGNKGDHDGGSVHAACQALLGAFSGAVPSQWTRKSGPSKASHGSPDGFD